MVVDRLRHILANDTSLREKVERTINKAAADNSDLQTNPVRSLDDLYIWLERFLTIMPWEGLEQGTRSKDRYAERTHGETAQTPLLSLPRPLGGG